MSKSVEEDYYDFVHRKEREGLEKDAPHGWIQWKGTNVCMDIHCKCGAHLHVDREFFYSFTCGSCQTIYAVGATVRLVELTEPKYIEEATSSAAHTVVFDDHKPTVVYDD